MGETTTNELGNEHGQVLGFDRFVPSHLESVAGVECPDGIRKRRTARLRHGALVSFFASPSASAPAVLRAFGRHIAGRLSRDANGLWRFTPSGKNADLFRQSRATRANVPV